jgi:hypothetical protein
MYSHKIKLKIPLKTTHVADLGIGDNDFLLKNNFAFTQQSGS